MSTRLILSIVQDEDANQLIDALRQGGYSSTKISTTGGFLRRGNVTLLIGVEEEQVDEVLKIIGANCRTRTQYVNPYMLMEPECYFAEPIEVQVGGAVIFVLTVDRLVRL